MKLFVIHFSLHSSSHFCVQKLSSKFCSGTSILPLGKETKFHTHVKVKLWYTSIVMVLNEILEDRCFRSINQQDLNKRSVGRF
jgi:hypothetical protein